MGKVFKALNKAMSNPEESVLPPPSAPGPSVKTERQPTPPRVEIPAGTMGSMDNTSGVNNWDEKLLAFSAPSSIITENIRHLRNRILHPPSGGPALRRVMVTSALPGEGKSMLCANLAISMAQGLEQHALLVDCDLRRSSLAQMLAVNNSQGLSNFLQHDRELGEVILQTELQKLALLPSGPRPMNPAELLDSKRVGEMFDELSNRYDDRFIIIDTPPLPMAAETTVLAKQVDGIIIVVRWGKAAREQVRQMTENLKKDKVIGVVFNAFERNILSAKLTGYEPYGHYGGY
ncbi:CpsD/CapB family tyrosine-protein kinase [Desulfobacterota bacterium M19]